MWKTSEGGQKEAVDFSVEPKPALTRFYSTSPCTGSPDFEVDIHHRKRARQITNPLLSVKRRLRQGIGHSVAVSKISSFASEFQR